jgi:rfaE bifunctional protein kinase chain/domain
MNAIMSAGRLEELVGRFAGARIAVLGDFFLDKYLAVDPQLAETSVETGKVAHQVVGVRAAPGVAGTVIGNLASLGAGTVHAIGFTGDDGEGFELRRGLTALNCRTEHLLSDPQRRTPTYLKPHDGSVAGLTGEHPRYDTKNRTPTAPPTERAIVAALDALLPQLDAVIIADQVEEDDCGVVTCAVRQAIGQRAEQHPHVVFWADSRRRICKYRHAIIKPNQFELIGWDSPPPGAEVPVDQLAPIIAAIGEYTRRPLVVTLGERGMLVCEGQLTHVPAVRVAGPVDTTGAGDSATAGAVLGLCAGATLPEAALVGNLTASITIEQLGTTGVARPGQLGPRLALWQKQRD